MHTSKSVVAFTLLLFASLPALATCTLSTTSPSVTICTPANSASVSSPVNVQAGTTDNEFAVKYLQIYVDGVKVTTIFAASLNTNVPMTSGAHRLTVLAQDAGGRTFKSTVDITVTTGSPASCTANPTQPSVTICSPANGATVTSPVSVVAEPNCQCTVRYMQVYVDGSKIYQVAAATLNASLTIAAGAHRLTVVAVDSTGATFKSSVNITVQSSAGGTSSPIKHLIVVVMQNRGFDHLFGTMAGVDGISPSQSSYTQTDANGNSVSAHLLTSVTTSDVNHSRKTYLETWDNGLMDKYAFYNGDMAMGHYDDTTAGVDKLWNWAQTYALGDNYFPSVMGTAPANQLFLVASRDYNNDPGSRWPFYGPCTQSTPQWPAMTFTNVGDQMTGAGISWGWFHEQYGQCGNGYIPQENPFQYFTSTHAAANVQDLSNFYTALTNGAVPAVSYIAPNPNHNGHPGSGSFTSAMNWLDGFLNKVRNSSTWPDCAVVVIWDENGGWWDHVSPPQVDSQGFGQRVPVIAVSPYAKKGYVSHVRMDHVSVLRFIHWNWGLPALTTREGVSNNLNDLFQF